jgi:hypothetical protein
MTPTDPHRQPVDHDSLPSDALQSVPQSAPKGELERELPRGERAWDRQHIIIEAVTVMVCAPLAVALIVTVTAESWPVWWLVFAGMLGAWAGDSVWNLASHMLAVLVARRHFRSHRLRHDQVHPDSTDDRRGGTPGHGQAGRGRGNDWAPGDPQ